LNGNETGEITVATEEIGSWKIIAYG